MTDADYDLCVIGGGINGVGIARDAAGRGLSVLLVEAKDIACATSSASSKLIHGGLRYLEFFEFSLVKASLREREILLNAASHVVRPMDFVLPHVPQQRPFWMLRLGLFLYDRLARRDRLHASYVLDLSSAAFGKPLSPSYGRGLCYADCVVDDSRLVVLNAMDASARGAEILTRTKCTLITPHEDCWVLDLEGKDVAQTRRVRASMVVNAAGPWVENILKDSKMLDDRGSVPTIRLVKGSHIIVPRAYEGDQSYLLQQKDGRVVFAIPYEGDYTLIGTTEEDFVGDAYAPMISDAEIEYLCQAFNGFFQKKISRADIAWTYSGVRPLVDSGAKEMRKASRDFRLYEHPQSRAPMISVFGGKLTTYRLLAEKVIDRILHMSNRFAAPWTASAFLPGGDFPGGDFDAFLQYCREEYSWLPPDLLLRYACAYGARMDRFLEGARSLSDLGDSFGAGLYEAEVAYLIRFEFARDVEDILWRRSKLGMAMNEEEIEHFHSKFKDILQDVDP
ncbi:MAG: glycerol-3-phosphate dehydrogenase [Alphaproteobacteria bacterium]|nr:glycerol-3-phosphate dehydrogenase [Alphaproteobacteria bacterium]